MSEQPDLGRSEVPQEDRGVGGCAMVMFKIFGVLVLGLLLFAGFVLATCNLR